MKNSHAAGEYVGDRAAPEGEEAREQPWPPTSKQEGLRSGEGRTVHADLGMSVLGMSAVARLNRPLWPLLLVILSPLVTLPTIGEIILS
jgi:hypothetical protein